MVTTIAQLTNPAEQTCKLVRIQPCATNNKSPHLGGFLFSIALIPSQVTSRTQTIIPRHETYLPAVCPVSRNGLPASVPAHEPSRESRPQNPPPLRNLHRAAVH